MRAGICSIQQALTVEALAVVKQAVSLARRRGHAQVTPLHVASSMLASSAGLLRRACLQSHSHPLQCKALELCFNVALNRLPASTPSTGLLHGYHSLGSLSHSTGGHPPSLSNALVAAFKRAQAHQRRGSIENQQQPILAMKIEMEQLVISILDDPSVSRVMREAGFSSTHIKSRVEQTVSVELGTRPDSASVNKERVAVITETKPLSALQFPPALALDQYGSDHHEDVASVFDALLSKRRRNVVIVGEVLSRCQGVVRGVIDRFERGAVPSELRSAQLISLPLFSLRNLSREEVEQKLVELRGLVESCVDGRGIVFYLGDLLGVSDFWSSYVKHRGSNYYCPSNLEYLVMEIKKLVCGFGEVCNRNNLWLMGIANFRTHMKCKAGHPSLEAIWGLQPITVPAGSLSLSLNLDTGSSVQVDSKSEVMMDAAKSSNFYFDKDLSAIVGREEIKALTIGTSMRSSLPPWLQQYKDEKSRDSDSLHEKEECDVSVVNLCEKWDSFCDRTHGHDPLRRKKLKFYSTPSSPTTSFSSHERNSGFFSSHLSWSSTMIELKQCPKEHQFLACDEAMIEPPKPELLSNPNSSPNSASSSEVAEDMNNHGRSFSEFNTDNVRILSDALVAKVPRQGEIVPAIVETVLRCRSGCANKGAGSRDGGGRREDTWMLFLGADSNAKESIARELAKLVFGSQSNFIGFKATAGKKRLREESGFNYVERFGEVVNENPHRVFFLEDIDQLDYSSKLSLKSALESGRMSVSGDEIVSLQDAIVIFSCESLETVSRREKTNSNGGGVWLDLNMAINDELHEKVEAGTGQMILDCVDRKIIFKLVQEQ
ncbi:hypothetical protein SAY86_030327 [Trapa natans]|uniref:Clp R domain-containing protein n=1 Tax=Trapa natans TaxID=22666 RepID=A0AAN7RH14_TRANT|nr:hypothetical protein SAY86_030327 [Trapa natans]